MSNTTERNRDNTALVVDGDATPLDRYLHIRRATERLCAPLVTEDYVVQSMPGASPTKWHRAHTSWFFEAFVRRPPLAGYLTEIGFDGSGFAFDNELPRHRVYLRPFQLANRAVTNGEFLQFVEAGGYHRWELWLSEGWRVSQERGWQAPLCWEQHDGAWWRYTLAGMRQLE